MTDTPLTQVATMPRRTFGGTLEVSALGFGCMNVAYAYGPRTQKMALFNSFNNECGRCHRFRF